MMWSFSQTTYPKITHDSLIVITPSQLKTTNLIFLEHKKTKQELFELYKKENTYKNIIKSYENSDSLKTIQINTMKEYSTNMESLVNEQNREIKKLKTNNNLIIIGGVTVSITLAILLLITN